MTIELRISEYREARRQYDADLPHMDQQEWEARTRELDDLWRAAQPLKVRGPTKEDALADIYQATSLLNEAKAHQRKTMQAAAELGCTYKAIADAAGIHVATVRSHLGKRRSKPPNEHA